MNRGRYVHLTPEEERTLREACQRGPKYEFRMRCLCLIMSHQHHSIGQLATYFGVSRHTIYNWFKAWHEYGLAGLYRQPGQGRKAMAERPAPTYTMTTAVHFSEANGAFSVYNRPTIPLLIREQGYGESQTTEYVSTWQLSATEYDSVLRSGTLYIRLFGQVPYPGLVRLYIWDAKPIAFAQQNEPAGNTSFLGIPALVEPYSLNGQDVQSTLSVWQLGTTGRETVAVTNYVVLSMVGQMVDCQLSAVNPF